MTALAVALADLAVRAWRVAVREGLETLADRDRDCRRCSRRVPLRGRGCRRRPRPGRRRRRSDAARPRSGCRPARSGSAGRCWRSDSRAGRARCTPDRPSCPRTPSSVDTVTALTVVLADLSRRAGRVAGRPGVESRRRPAPGCRRCSRRLPGSGSGMHSTPSTGQTPVAARMQRELARRRRRLAVAALAVVDADVVLRAIAVAGGPDIHALARRVRFAVRRRCRRCRCRSGPDWPRSGSCRKRRRHRRRRCRAGPGWPRRDSCRRDRRRRRGPGRWRRWSPSSRHRRSSTRYSAQLQKATSAGRSRRLGQGPGRHGAVGLDAVEGVAGEVRLDHVAVPSRTVGPVEALGLGGESADERCDRPVGRRWSRSRRSCCTLA